MDRTTSASTGARRSARFALSAATVLASLALAACGSSGSSTSGTPTSTVSTSATVGSTPSPTSTSIAGLKAYTGLSRDHVTTKVTYPVTPPVGGKHSAVWQNCGIYSAPVANENAVHSLEHGAMWITYRPDLPADQVTAIKSAVAGQRYGLVSPYPGLPAPVVATVWGAQVQLDSATDPRLKAFVDRYASGARAPEPGAKCTDGLGTPSG